MSRCAALLIAALLFAAPCRAQNPYTYRLDWHFGAPPAENSPALRSDLFSIEHAFAYRDGSIYFLEQEVFDHSGFYRIRRLTPQGTLQTATVLRLPRVAQFSGFAISPDGLVYYADSFNNQVKRINAAGDVELVAGRGGLGFGGDGGPAVDAYLSMPTALLFDFRGDLLIADTGAHRIRRVDSRGVITVVAGAGAGGDGGPAVSAQVLNPQSLTADRAGNLYVAEGSGNRSVLAPRIRKISPAGVITTVYTNSSGIGDIAADSQGGLFLVRRLPTQLSGQGSLTRIGPDGKAVDVPGASTIWIRCLTATPDGVPVVCDSRSSLGRVDGGRFTRIAGTDRHALNTPLDSVAHDAFLPDGVHGLTLNSFGVYFSNFTRVGFIDRAGKLIVVPLAIDWSPILDSRGSLYYLLGSSVWKVDGANIPKLIAGPATGARFNDPRSIVLDGDNVLYLADTQNHLIRRIDLRTGDIQTVVGDGNPGDSGDGGPDTKARINRPTSLALDRDGNLYFGDTNSARIRKVTRAGIITTVAGTGTPGSSGDGGPASAASVTAPFNLAFDLLGNLYFTDFNPMRIRMIDRRGIVRTIAGGGNRVYSPDGADPLREELGYLMVGLAVDADGTVYFGDIESVRKLVPITSEFPRLTLEGILNGASFLPGPVAPGMIATLYGSNIGPSRLSSALPAAGVFPSILERVRVLFDGVPAPLLYATSGQVGLVVPYSVAGKAVVSVAAELDGARSLPVNVSVAAARPAIFSADSSGLGPGAILNQDGTLNSRSNPAERGSIVVLYATGEGQTTPAGRDGLVNTTSFPKPILPVSVEIGGVSAQILYAGAAPLAISGLIQINASVPAASPTGDAVPVVLRVGNFSSTERITFAVAPAR